MKNKIIRIKVCCISSIEEAELAIGCGASAIGLVSEMPSGPGVIPENKIAEIASIIPPGISSFLLTSKQDVSEIIEQQKRTGVNTIQIVDRLKSGSYDDFRKAIPGISIVQVIHVNGEESLSEAARIKDKVNGILLDSGNQSKPVKELGGTGRTHNWDISRQIVESVKIPVYLAGGLNRDNVREAIGTVKPFGIDICSGVRTNGELDEIKLKGFIERIMSA